LENNNDVHYLVLPARKGRALDMSKAELQDLLHRETAGDDSLAYWLPAEIIAEAFFNNTYKHHLFVDPAQALADMGFSWGPRAGEEARLRVVENSTFTYHLILPASPTGQEDLSFAGLADSLRIEFGTSTTKCCAGGTTA